MSTCTRAGAGAESEVDIDEFNRGERHRGASSNTLKGSARSYAALRAAFQALSSLLSFAALLLPAVAAAECASAPPIIGADQKCVETLTVVAFGDSLMAGFSLPASQAFPAQLERRLAADGFPVRVVNAGVSGDTTTDGLARLDYALAEKPDLVILELGANDMLRGVDPKVTRENLEKMLAAIKEKGAAILLAGMKASGNYGDAYRRSSTRSIQGSRARCPCRSIPFFSTGWIRTRRFCRRTACIRPPRASRGSWPGSRPPSRRAFGRS